MSLTTSTDAPAGLPPLPIAERERLDNVSIRHGTPDDPKLPPSSFDRIFLVHMYHEVSEPYAFLWRLRPALHDGGQVIVVDGGNGLDENRA